MVRLSLGASILYSIFYCFFAWSTVYAAAGVGEGTCPTAQEQRLCERRLQEQTAGQSVGRVCEEEGTYFGVSATPGTNGGASQSIVRITSCNDVQLTGRCQCMVVWRDANNQNQYMRVPVGSGTGEVLDRLEPTGQTRTIDQIAEDRRLLEEQRTLEANNALLETNRIDLERNMNIFGDRQNIDDFDFDTRVAMTDAFRADAERLEAEARLLAPTPTARELELGLERYTVQQLEMIAGDSMLDNDTRGAALRAAELLRQAEDSQRLANLLGNSVTLEMRLDGPLADNRGDTDRRQMWWNLPNFSPSPMSLIDSFYDAPYVPGSSFSSIQPSSVSTWQWPSFGQVGTGIADGFNWSTCWGRRLLQVRPNPGDAATCF